jgi:hypothetical protein
VKDAVEDEMQERLGVEQAMSQPLAIFGATVPCRQFVDGQVPRMLWESGGVL